MCVYICIDIYICLHVKYPLFLSYFNETQILNFIKILSLKTELFYTDGQTDRWKVGRTG